MVQYELSCYEIGGNEPVDQIDPRQIIDADAILLVFSLGSPDAIQQVRFYQARLAQIAPDIPMFLVGTTTNMEGQEAEQRLANDIEEMARNWRSRGFWKTSVAQGLNVQGLLANLIALPRAAGKTALKIVFAGPAGGGKSALIARLANAELTGIYTPTSRSRITTVRLDALAPTSLGEEEKEDLQARGEELRQQPIVVEKLAADKFDSTRGVPLPEERLKAPPSVADKVIQRDLPPLAGTPAEEHRAPPPGKDESIKFGFLNNDVLQDLKRIKPQMRSPETPSQPGVPAGKTSPPPPGAPKAPGAAQPAGGRELMMQELQGLLNKQKSLSAVSNERTPPPIESSVPPAVSEGMPLADGTAPPPSGPEMQEPVELVTKGSSAAPPAALAGGASRPAPITGGEGAFAEGDKKRSEAAPARPTPHALTQPATPPLLPSTGEEADHRFRGDEKFSEKKSKRKEAAKAEKRSREKVAADDSEEITTEMETEAGEKFGKPTAEPDRTVTVERVLERKTTVFYRKQMNPLTRNKLSVVLSTLKIYEQLKLQTIVPAERAGGEQTLKIRELSPFIQVQPIFPGCICVPAQVPLDARKDSDTADFHITPLATGEIMDACVRIYYEGKLVDTIQTPTKVVTQTTAKTSAAAAAILPVFAPYLDERILALAPSLEPFWNMVGGLSNLIMYIAGALAFLGAIMYYAHRPKQAMPIEANFPELQQFLEEEVKRPPLAEVLKEKGEQEKGQNI